MTLDLTRSPQQQRRDTGEDPQGGLGANPTAMNVRVQHTLLSLLSSVENVMGTQC